jgi:hypothetical protein
MELKLVLLMTWDPVPVVRYQLMLAVGQQL